MPTAIRSLWRLPATGISNRSCSRNVRPVPVVSRSRYGCLPATILACSGTEPASGAPVMLTAGVFISGDFSMTSAYFLVIACGLLALAYGWFTSRQVLSANAGTARMQEISGAVQVGAKAYLNRQYRAIAIVGVVVLIILGIPLGLRVSIGYLIGAVLSAAAGYVGMN